MKGNKLKLIKIALLIIFAILGVALVVFGTSITTVDRYLIPPQILPGLAVLYFCSLLVAIITVRENCSISFLRWLKEIVVRKIGAQERDKLRNMVLILTFFMVAFSMTRGVTPMYRVIANNYFISLFINILVSVISSIGLFGWLSSLYMSKQSKEES